MRKCRQRSQSSTNILEVATCRVPRVEGSSTLFFGDYRVGVYSTVDYHSTRAACAAGGGITCGVMQDDRCFWLEGVGCCMVYLCTAGMVKLTTALYERVMISPYSQ